MAGELGTIVRHICAGDSALYRCTQCGESILRGQTYKYDFTNCEKTIQHIDCKEEVKPPKCSHCGRRAGFPDQEWCPYCEEAL